MLSQQMIEATKLLEQVLEGYVSFHAELREKTSCHPSMVDEALMKYDSGLCQYFGVSRDPPIQKVNNQVSKQFSYAACRAETLQLKFGEKMLNLSSNTIYMCDLLQ